MTLQKYCNLLPAVAVVCIALQSVHGASDIVFDDFDDGFTLNEDLKNHGPDWSVDGDNDGDDKAKISGAEKFSGAHSVEITPGTMITRVTRTLDPLCCLGVFYRPVHQTGGGHLDDASLLSGF